MTLVPVNLRASILWVTDAATMFVNGFISGIATGSIIGGTAAASSESTDPQALTFRAAVGLVLTAFAHGVKTVVVWHHTHPFPNPFRNSDHTPSNESSSLDSVQRVRNEPSGGIPG